MALEMRKKETRNEKRIDNASLCAGSDMYYYCRICGLLADVLPESHAEPPRQYCSECAKMLEAGFSQKLGKFTEWEEKTCPDCNGRGNYGRIDYYTKRPRTCMTCGGKRTIRVEA